MSINGSAASEQDKGGKLPICIYVGRRNKIQQCLVEPDYSSKGLTSSLVSLGDCGLICY